MASFSATLGRSRKNTPSKRSARVNSGGSLEMSLEVPTKKTSESWSDSQVSKVPNSRFQPATSAADALTVEWGANLQTVLGQTAPILPARQNDQPRFVRRSCVSRAPGLNLGVKP